jgi:hypothetical protein
VPSPIGQNPVGFVVFEADRMLVAAADARPSATVGPSRALLSYTGTYRLDGTELVTSADAASRPDMVTEQVRDIRFDGPTRFVATPKAGMRGPRCGRDVRVGARPVPVEILFGSGRK